MLQKSIHICQYALYRFAVIHEARICHIGIAVKIATVVTSRGQFDICVNCEKKIFWKVGRVVILPLDVATNVGC